MKTEQRSSLSIINIGGIDEEYELLLELAKELPKQLIYLEWTEQQYLAMSTYLALSSYNNRALTFKELNVGKGIDSGTQSITSVLLQLTDHIYSFYETRNHQHRNCEEAIKLDILERYLFDAKVRFFTEDRYNQALERDKPPQEIRDSGYELLIKGFKNKIKVRLCNKKESNRFTMELTPDKFSDLAKYFNDMNKYIKMNNKLS